MELSNNLGEYRESIIRPQALPREVDKVWKDIEYSNKLRKVHDIMKKLDLTDSRDDMIRKQLLKFDDKILEELSKKSKQDIIIFLKQQQNNENYQENWKLNEIIQKIKSVFTPQILEQNPKLVQEFNNLDKEWSNKQEILNNILTLLKDDKILKSITEQLW